jgi:hypothetical protein
LSPIRSTALLLSVALATITKIIAMAGRRWIFLDMKSNAVDTTIETETDTYSIILITPLKERC